MSIEVYYYTASEKELNLYNSIVTINRNYKPVWAEIIEINGNFYIQAHPIIKANFKKIKDLPQPNPSTLQKIKNFFGL